MTFLNWMSQALETINPKDIKLPQGLIKEGDKVIGVITDLTTQKLYGLCERTRKEFIDMQIESIHKMADVARSLLNEHRPDHNPRTCQLCACRRKLETSIGKFNMVDLLFWSNVRYSLDEDAIIKLDEAGGDMYLAENWQIVAAKQKEVKPRTS